MRQRELLIIDAIYYPAGTPVATIVGQTEESDILGNFGQLWWYPGVAQIDSPYQAQPAIAPEGELATEAVLLEPHLAARNGVMESFDLYPGIIAYLWEGSSWRDIFHEHVETLKGLCDIVRGESGAQHVHALVVCACEAGKDEDNWTGAGDYWETITPIGLLDLRTAEVQTLARSREEVRATPRQRRSSAPACTRWSAA